MGSSSWPCRASVRRDRSRCGMTAATPSTGPRAARSRADPPLRSHRLASPRRRRRHHRPRRRARPRLRPRPLDRRAGRRGDEPLARLPPGAARLRRRGAGQPGAWGRGRDRRRRARLDPDRRRGRLGDHRAGACCSPSPSPTAFRSTWWCRIAGWRCSTRDGGAPPAASCGRGSSACWRRPAPLQADIVMHCGVGICGPCYEVGSEVMTGCGLPAGGPGPWHLDLRRAPGRARGRPGLGGVTRLRLVQRPRPPFLL